MLRATEWGLWRNCVGLCTVCSESKAGEFPGCVHCSNRNCGSTMCLCGTNMAIMMRKMMQSEGAGISNCGSVRLKQNQNCNPPCMCVTSCAAPLDGSYGTFHGFLESALCWRRFWLYEVDSELQGTRNVTIALHLLRICICVCVCVYIYIHIYIYISALSHKWCVVFNVSVTSRVTWRKRVG
jgi:hypothetical protein